MQSDEFAIDHLNGLRLSYNSKDVTDYKSNLKQKQNLMKSEKSSDNNDSDISNGIQQRYRRHKKSKKNKKMMKNGEANYSEDSRYGSDYAEESKHLEDEEVPNRRLMIVTTPLTERRRGSSRRKSHPPGARTKIPKIPIAAGRKGGSPNDEKAKLNNDEEDEEDEKGNDTESYLYSEGKDSDTIYTDNKDEEKEKKDSFKIELKTPSIGLDSKSTRLDFIWKMHLRFRSLGIMTNGLVAGLALSQCIFIFSFSDKTKLKDDYSDLALLFQSIYYVLLTISTVSVLDSFFSLDSDWAGFLKHLIARPLRAVTLISYVLSLIFSISLAQLDDSISMNHVSMRKLDTWKALNMFRVITSIIGWVSVSFSPLDDVTGTGILSKKAMEHEKLKDESNCRMNGTTVSEVTT